MSSPEEETTPKTISPSSRESSFFSLTSGNSVYFSAKDTLSQSNTNSDGSGENVSYSGGGGGGGGGVGGPAAAVVKPDKLKLDGSLKIRGGGGGGGSGTGQASRKEEDANGGDDEGEEDDGDGSGGSGGVSSVSSATLEEADSMTSFSDAGDYGNDITPNGDDSTLLKRTPSNSSVEVKKGISRLCSNIANVDSFNVTKKKQIENALESLDVHSLRKLAAGNGGLLSNGLREHGWSLLLGIPPKELTKKRNVSFRMEFSDVTEQVQNLVRLDVARVLKRFPPGLSDPQQNHLQTVLSNLICAVLQKNPQAHYYQGFHDISLTFLLVASVESNPYLAYLCLNKMIETNLGPHMERTMESTHELIHTIYAIIEKEDKPLFKKIVVDTKCPVAFCLPWVLTWFSHTLPDDSDVFRLYDYMLGNQKTVDPPYLIPIFVSAALVLRNSKKILQDSTLTDIASMHQALSKLPSELKSLEPWLEESTELMRRYKGHEDSLVHKARKVKEMQQDLWNDESNNNQRRRPARTGNLVIYTSRLLFVRYRWTTISLLVLLTSYFLHTRYQRSIFQLEFFRSTVDNYAPTKLRSLFRYPVEDNQRE